MTLTSVCLQELVRSTTLPSIVVRIYLESCESFCDHPDALELFAVVCAKWPKMRVLFLDEKQPPFRVQMSQQEVPDSEFQFIGEKCCVSQLETCAAADWVGFVGVPSAGTVARKKLYEFGHRSLEEVERLFGCAHPPPHPSTLPILWMHAATEKEALASAPDSTMVLKRLVVVSATPAAAAAAPEESKTRRTTTKEEQEKQAVAAGKVLV